MPKNVVSARLPIERVNQLEKIAEEEKVDKTTILDRALEIYIKEWKLQKAINKYREGTATLPRAAEIAELSIWEMIDALNREQVPTQYNLQDLEEDLKVEL